MSCWRFSHRNTIRSLTTSFASIGIANSKQPEAQSRTASGSARMPSSTTTSQPTPSSDFESWWRKCVHDGFVPNTALQAKSVSVNAAGLSQANAGGAPAVPASSTSQFEIVFRTDPTIYDGRFANNGWLQELPKPLSKLTWDNAALVSPNTAKRLGLAYKIGSRGGEHGTMLVDLVELQYQERVIRAPI